MTRKREILLSFLSTALFSFIILVAPVRVIAQQLLAPAWPLAVKNPFLNTWYQAGPNLLPLGDVWPNFWDPSITGWYCDALVDGVHYHLMGEDYFMLSKPVKQSSVRVTPTRTIIEVVAGPVNISMTFLTPITASDFTRQSLPFSYFLVTVVSADDSQHSVKFYSDISAEWATGDTSFTANSAVETDIDFVILQTSLKAPVPFAEISEHAQDSVALYAIKNGPGINYEVGEDEVVRSASLNSTAGGLQNNVDPNISSHPIDSPFDVWGISVDLGLVTSTTTSPAVWAIAVTREPSIQFTTLSGNVQLRSSYYRMNFSMPHDMVSFFLNDFENALNASIQLDLQITNDATNISQEYVDLLSLVSRQAMSALEITVSKDASGNFNASDIMIFLKDMGSVSEGGVNAVDVLYAAFPIYLYLNPDIGGHLLKPLLQSQDVPQYSQPFATQGLGTNYPNATISNLPHDSGIEQSGNMIIMLLAHLQSSGDSSLIRQHYSLIKKWADYLVQISLSPGMQQPSFSDGIVSVNQTNVALKGILGIAAMAKLSSSMGIDSDASNYESVAESYIGKWQILSLSSDKTHLLTSFGQDASAGLIYNMYADKLLKLDLIPQYVYDLQTAYYKSQLAANKFGIPLSSESQNLTRADWMFFAGAASGDEDLQRSLISLVHSYVFTPSEVTPLSTVYDPTTGISIAGSNSPAIGGLFAPLALKTLSSKTAGPVIPGANGRQRSKFIVRLVGGVAGSITFLALVIIAFISRRRRKTRKNHHLHLRHHIISGEPEGNSEGRTSYGLDPFILPPKSDHETSPTVISTSESSRRYSVQVQAPVPSIRDEGPSTSGWADLRREVSRLRREIRRYLGDRYSFARPPPSYVSQQPSMEREAL